MLDKLHIMRLMAICMLGLSLLFYSCSKEPVPNDPLLHFSEDVTKYISPSSVLDLEKYDIFKPEIVLKQMNGYMVKSQVEENMVAYVDPVKKNAIYGINRGDAPEELVSPSSFQKKKEDTFIYDISKRKAYKVNISLNDSNISLSEYRFYDVEEHPFIVHFLDKGGIASGIFSQSWIVQFNDEGRIMSHLNFPSFEETEGFTDIELSTLYLSTLIAVSPDEKKVVCAAQKGGVLAFANLNGQGMEEYQLIKYYAPKVSSSHKRGDPNIAFSRDNKIGFCGVSCNDKYVFALYSGRTFATHGMSSHHCEHVLVYDWEGNPVKHLVLDKPLYTMNYDAQTNQLYGIGYDPEGCILEYDLSENI